MALEPADIQACKPITAGPLRPCTPYDFVSMWNQLSTLTQEIGSAGMRGAVQAPSKPVSGTCNIVKELQVVSDNDMHAAGAVADSRGAPASQQAMSPAMNTGSWHQQV